MFNDDGVGVVVLIVVVIVSMFEGMDNQRNMSLNCFYRNWLRPYTLASLALSFRHTLSTWLRKMQLTIVAGLISLVMLMPFGGEW